MSQHQFGPLRERAFRFSVEIVRFCRALPHSSEARLIARQLFRAGTAVGANYQAASRGRSDREFIAKLGVVVEEADESTFWLRLLLATENHAVDATTRLLEEADELLRIFSASLRTARANRKRRKAAEASKKRK
jgi:four helix bundle protein